MLSSILSGVVSIHCRTMSVSTARLITVQLQSNQVYIITVEEFDHHTDEEGRMHIPHNLAFTSLTEANKTAHEIFTEYEPEYIEYAGVRDNSGCFKAEARHVSNDIDTLYVEVKPMKMVIGRRKRERSESSGDEDKNQDGDEDEENEEDRNEDEGEMLRCKTKQSRTRKAKLA